MEKAKTVALWVLAILLVLSGTGYLLAGAALGGLLYILVAAIIIPIPALQDKLYNLNVRGGVKVGVVLALLVVGTAFLPKETEETPSEDLEIVQAEIQEPAQAEDSVPEDTEPEQMEESASPVEETENPITEEYQEEEILSENSEPEPTDQIEESEAEVIEPELEETVFLPLETCISAMKLTLDSNYGSDNYTLTYDDNYVTINLWRDGVAFGALEASNGDAEMLELWNSMVDGTTAMTNSMQETLNQFGHGDMAVMTNVVNDMNHENVLLVIMLGAVWYDSVNGINLLGM